jgi:hypothetical protein
MAGTFKIFVMLGPRMNAAAATKLAAAAAAAQSDKQCNNACV